MQIKDKVERILEMQSRLTVELHNLQSECPHTNKTGEYGADTGNWCPHDDDYWISVNCKDCSKSWTIFHSNNPDEYRKFDGVKIK